MIKIIKIVIIRLYNTFNKPSKKDPFFEDELGNLIYNSVQLTDTELEGSNVVFEGVRLFKVQLGRHSYIQKYSRINMAKIGRFCSIAGDVKIGLGIHKVNGLSTHPAFFLKNTPLQKVFVNEDQFIPHKDVTIGNDVWIGEGAIIMDGVNIETGAIIAAGAVVTKDVAPYEIVGGVPAKRIKTRFPKEIIDKLLQSEWWLQSDEWLEKNFQKLENEIIS